MEERTFCGLNKKEMKKVLYFMCDLEPKLELTDDETDKYDVAMQCIGTIINCMEDNSSIEWE